MKLILNGQTKKVYVLLCAQMAILKHSKNIEIYNLNKVNLGNEDYLFHAGTLKKDNKIYAVGGRVLNFVSLSKNFKTAREKIFSNLNKLNWKNGFYRKDIGYKVIDK